MVHGLKIPCILTFQTSDSELSDKSRKLIEASLAAINIKIFRNEKMRMESLDPVPSLSQHVHGAEIKLEQTDVSDNSDINLVDPLPGNQTDSLSLSPECSTSIGEPVAKKQCLSKSEYHNGC